MNTALWSVTTADVASIRALSDDLCRAIPGSVEDRDTPTSNVIQGLDGPERQVDYQQTLKPGAQSDSINFALFLNL